MSIDGWLQLAIIICGASSLLATNLRWRWGPWLGVVHQPLWVWFAWRTGTWAPAVCAVLYGGSYAVGIYRGRRKERNE